MAIVTVRFAPLPPKVMLAFGTSVVLEELPVTVRLPAALRIADSKIRQTTEVGQTLPARHHGDRRRVVDRRDRDHTVAMFS